MDTPLTDWKRQKRHLLFILATISLVSRVKSNNTTENLTGTPLGNTNVMNITRTVPITMPPTVITTNATALKANVTALPVTTTMPNTTTTPSITTVPTTATTTLATTTMRPKICKPGWRKYGENCYKIYDAIYMWNGARKRCLKENADLASINSKGELSWLIALVSEVPRESIWIGLKYEDAGFVWSDNSSFTIAYWSPDLNKPENWHDEPCVYIGSDTTKNPGYWFYSPCTAGRTFICETSADEAPDDYKAPPPSGCSNGMIAWGSSCYWFVDELMTALQGSIKCGEEKNGHPFNIYDLPELYFIKSLLLQREGETFWTGLNQLSKKGIFQWAHGQPLNLNTRVLGLNLPAGYKVSTAGRCSYMKAERGIHTMRLDKCFGKHKVLCEKLRKGYTTSAPWVKQVTTTTERPEICPYTNFKMYNGKCIMAYNKKTLSWRQAEDYCHKYGGHLLHYNTYQNNPSIYSLYSKNYWIGLKIPVTKEKTSPNDVRWADGTIAYNYNGHYPSPKKEPLCAYRKDIYTSDPTFHFASCSEHKYFVCEVNNGYELQPSPEIRDEKFMPCLNREEGWWEFHGYCYYHSHVSKKNHEKKMMWGAANRTCVEKGGDLVSIHNNDEAEFLVKLARRYTNFNPWIGLRNELLSHRFYWSDKSPLNVQMWNVDSLKTYYMDKCVALNTKTGHWDIDQCHKTKYFICKKFSKVSVTRPKPTYANCKANWHAFRDKCFRTYISTKTWLSASRECRRVGGALTSIRSQAEQDYLILLANGNKFWTGLSDRSSEGNLKWHDGLALTYTNWASGEPNDELNSMDEDCIESLSAASKGQWNDIPCTRYLPFICQYYRESLVGGAAPTPNPLPPFVCPASMEKQHGYCYFFSNESMSFDDAEEECFYKGGYLMHIKGMKSILSHRTAASSEENKNNYWLKPNGLNFRNAGPDYLPSQWNGGKFGEYCSTLNETGSIATVVKCLEKNRFICEIIREKPAALQAVEGKECPNEKSEGWLDFRGEKCYKLLQNTYKWSEGQKICRLQNSEMVSIHSINELRVLSVLFKEFYSNAWIGMKKDEKTGASFWADGSATDFFNWEKGEPNKDGNKSCVQVDRSSLKWTYTYCYYRRHVICSADKILSTTASTNNADHSGTGEQKQEIAETPSTSPRYGYIIGFTILALCILGLIAVGIFYAKKRYQYRDISSRNTRGSESERLTSH